MAEQADHPEEDWDADRIFLLETKHACDLVRARIEEHERRSNDQMKVIEETRKSLESNSRVFNVRLGAGLALGVVVLLLTLYALLRPLVEDAANILVKSRIENEVNKVDWDEKLSIASREELARIVNSETIRNAIDQETIDEAIATVTQSKEFQALVDSHTSDAVKHAVTAAVQRMIVETEFFKKTIEDQVAAKRKETADALGTITPVSASSRGELVNGLVVAISEYDALGKSQFKVVLHPQGDALAIVADVWWENDIDLKKRVRLTHFGFEGIDLTSNSNRNAIAEYLGQEVPSRVFLAHAPMSDSSNHQFVIGIDYSNTPRFETYDKAAHHIAENAVLLAEECLSITYPVIWRTQPR